LFWRAVAASWVIVIVPSAMVAGVGSARIVMAAAAAGPIALGTFAFALSQPIRHVPLTTTRWFCQGSAAALASVLAWIVVG
jgi:hypothetical protein